MELAPSVRRINQQINSQFNILKMKLLPLAVILAITSPLPTIGQTVIYTGESGGAWEAGSNWNTGTKPTSADNASVRVPGPVVNTPNETANNLYMAGGAETTTVTVATGGSLTTVQDARVGIGNSGTTELIVDGGTLTANRDIYVSQTDNGGSRVTVHSGTLNVTSTLRVGFQEPGHLQLNGGKIAVGNHMFIAQNAGTDGSTAILTGGEIATVGSIFLGYAGDSLMQILDGGISINVGGAFEFGRDGLATLEFVLAADGTTSPINTGSMTLGEGVSRVLTVDGSGVTDPSSLTSILLFHSLGDPFTEVQLATLSAALNLVDLSGLTLQLANGGADIVLMPEAATWAGFPVYSGSYVDTESYIGWLYIGTEPWLYSYSLGGWIYGEEAGFASNGTWIYKPK